MTLVAIKESKCFFWVSQWVKPKRTSICERTERFFETSSRQKARTITVIQSCVKQLTVKFFGFPFLGFVQGHLLLLVEIHDIRCFITISCDCFWARTFSRTNLKIYFARRSQMRPKCTFVDRVTSAPSTTETTEEPPNRNFLCLVIKKFREFWKADDGILDTAQKAKQKYFDLTTKHCPVKNSS